MYCIQVKEKFLSIYNLQPKERVMNNDAKTKNGLSLTP